MGARGNLDRPAESADSTGPPRAGAGERLYYLLILAVSIVGWIVFFYLWTDVLARPVWIELKISLFQLGIFLLLIASLTALWIRHNIWRAVHGSRGRSSRLVLIDHDEDFFGRRLELPSEEALKGSRHITIEADDSIKCYRVSDEEIGEVQAS